MSNKEIVKELTRDNKDLYKLFLDEFCKEKKEA